jgi:hypothetical protein
LIRCTTCARTWFCLQVQVLRRQRPSIFDLSLLYRAISRSRYSSRRRVCIHVAEYRVRRRILRVISAGPYSHSVLILFSWIYRKSDQMFEINGNPEIWEHDLSYFIFWERFAMVTK